MAQIWEREDTLENIGRLLADARQGRGRTLFIVGEPGLGKTTMVERALEAARSEFQIGLGRGDATESALPFGIIDQALGRLGFRIAVEPKAKGRSPAQARGARQYAALQFLESLQHPALLLLDDLQWADEDSLTLLSFLCRRIANLTVAIIGTLRPWPRTALAIAIALTRSGDAQLQRLRPLTEASAADMLKGLSDGTLSPSSARRAATLAAGNPLLIEQVASTLRRGRALPESNGDLATTEASLLSTWFAGGSPEELRYAQAASVLGSRFRPSIAAAMAQLPEREGDRILEALLQAGVFKSDAKGWARFSHPLLRQVIYEEIPAALCSRWHASAFRLLEEAGADNAECAEHAAQAGLLGDQKAIAVLMEAGRAAMRTGAIARARQRLAAAAEVAGANAPADLLMDLAQVQLEAGDPHAVGTCRRMLELPGLTPHQRNSAQRLLGRALFVRGAVVEANDAFNHAVASAIEHDKADAVRALLDQAFISWPTRGPAMATPLLERARDLSSDTSPALRSRVETAWAFSTFVSGDPSGIPVIESHVREALANPQADTTDFAWSWGTLGTYGNMAKWTERFDEATVAYQVGMKAAERMGLPVAIASVAVMHADTCLRTGDLRLAYQLADRATLDADLAPERAFWAAMIHCYVANEEGDMEDCARWLERSKQLADSAEDWAGRVWLLHMEAVLAMHARNTETACALFDRLQRLATRLQILEPCIVPWAGDAITAYAYAGRVNDALSIVSSLESMAQRLACRFPRIVVLGARAAFSATFDAAGATRLLEEAVELAHLSSMPLLEARMRHRLGSLWLDRGNPETARPLLREAQAEAKLRGAEGLADKAGKKLKAAGGRQRPTKVDPDAFTPAEDRVYSLAIRGLRARQIAAQLFVTENTVETHLQHIYRKRGVTSQKELMEQAHQLVAP